MKTLTELAQECGAFTEKDLCQYGPNGRKLVIFNDEAVLNKFAELIKAPLQVEIDRLKAELNALDKALRCEGWPLEARLERAEMLAELDAKQLIEPKFNLFGYLGHELDISRLQEIAIKYLPLAAYKDLFSITRDELYWLLHQANICNNFSQLPTNSNDAIPDGYVLVKACKNKTVTEFYNGLSREDSYRIPTALKQSNRKEPT